MSNQTHQQFADSLRTRRKALGMSQEDIAKALSIAGRTVQRWEGGETGGYRRYLSPLADLLQTTPAALQGEEEHPELRATGHSTAAPHDGDDVAELRDQVASLTDEIRALRRYLLDPAAVRAEARRLLQLESDEPGTPAGRG